MNAEELTRELVFLRAKASSYAFWGTVIASAAVMIATLLVSYFTVGEISLDGIMLGQQSNIALWVLDTMPFVFATWGQYASFKMVDEATLLVADKTKDLREAIDTLKLSTQAKSDFFSKMSHELRAPLNGVIGMVEMLLETRLDSEQRRCAGVIKTSANGLLNLINDILDFSKIEAGKLALEHIEFDFRECIEGCVALLLPQARMKNLQLTTHIPQNIPARLIGDPGRIRQIIINLVSNALKFTERGEIVLYTQLVGDEDGTARLRCDITDTGIGMSQATLSRLFQPYSQGDPSTTRKFGGTGLGLAISKELVETMGGDISVSSKENQGSTFSFTLKLRKAAAGSELSPVPSSLNGLRALIADENSSNRSSLAKQLREVGVEVEQVADGVAALQMILVAASTGYRFDLVLVDMFLPCMSGEELGRELKSRAETKNIVMVMMTAVGQRGDAQRLNEIGFAAYIPKPFPADAVARLAVAAMATRQLSEDERRRRGVITKYTLQATGKKSLHLLLAEDSAVNREILLNTLRKMGHTADVAVNGEEAVRIAWTRQYDAILMDLQMPVMDGFGAIEAIRELPAPYGRVPIVALTAGVTDEERQRCRDRGANAIMLKPASAADFTRVLAEVLGGTADDTPAESGGAQTTQTNVIKIFLTEATQRVASINEAIKAQDTKQIMRDAHTLKGVSAHFKADGLRAAAAQLEQLAAHGKLDEARGSIKTLEEAFNALQFRLLKQLEQPTHH